MQLLLELMAAQHLPAMYLQKLLTQQQNQLRVNLYKQERYIQIQMEQFGCMHKILYIN